MVVLTICFRDDVMAANLHFFSKALSQLQFCFDCLQNCSKGRKLSSDVSYFKSATPILWTGFLKKIQNGCLGQHFLNQASKMSIFIDIDLHITNLNIAALEHIR